MLLKGMEFDTAHFITDVSGKYPRLWALKGAHPVNVNRWYKFGVLASIRTIAPGVVSVRIRPNLFYYLCWICAMDCCGTIIWHTSMLAVIRKVLAGLGEVTCQYEDLSGPMWSISERLLGQGDIPNVKMSSTEDRQQRYQLATIKPIQASRYTLKMSKTHISDTVNDLEESSSHSGNDLAGDHNAEETAQTPPLPKKKVARQLFPTD
ncbi:hypothetical protein ACS0TY_013802 [Phlomoides rotata]